MTQMKLPLSVGYYIVSCLCRILDIMGQASTFFATAGVAYCYSIV